MEKEVAQVIELAALGTGHVEYACFSVSAEFNFNFLHLDLSASVSCIEKKTESNFQAEKMYGKNMELFEVPIGIAIIANICESVDLHDRIDPWIVRILFLVEGVEAKKGTVCCLLRHPHDE